MKIKVSVLGLIGLILFAGSIQETFGKAGEDALAAIAQRTWPLMELAAQRPSSPSSASQGQILYHTHPEFNGIMTTTVTSPAQNTAPGYLFVAPLGEHYDGPSAIMILDNNGEPVYIDALYGEPFASDFKKQTVNGTDYLTYQTNRLPDGSPCGYSLVMDENYQVVNTWSFNSCYSDIHEFLLLENGHAIVLAYVPTPIDLSPYGGPVDGRVIDAVLQEQDENKNVIFEWRATEHLPIDDSELNLNSTGLIDFIHTNAVEVDDDGNWLLSHRHFSEITKIDRQTGDVIWRMGGKGNEFTFTNDIGFSRQHDIRRLGNGNITIFDNGNNHNPPHSRAIEYAIDEVTKTVTRVWAYPGDMSEYSFALANNQRLPNGNALIGWGTTPKLTEVEPDGTVAFEMLLGSWNYRAFRFPWSGKPLMPPRTAVQYGTDTTAVTLFTSWNGATDITEYEIYAGQTPGTLLLLETLPRDGFETEVPLVGLPPNTCFFQTRPIHAQADPTPFSNMVFRADLPACLAQLNTAYSPLIANP